MTGAYSERFAWVSYAKLRVHPEQTMLEALAEILTDAEMEQFAGREAVPEDVSVWVSFS